jgi:hypothetical protein
MNCLFLLFLFWSSFTLPHNEPDTSSFEGMDQSYNQLFEDDALSSFKCLSIHEQIKFIRTAKYQSLPLSLLHMLSNDQLVLLVETNNNFGCDLLNHFEPTDQEKMEKEIYERIVNLLIKKESIEALRRISKFIYKEPLQSTILTYLENTTYNPFLEYQTSGPVFDTYDTDKYVDVNAAAYLTKHYTQNVRLVRDPLYFPTFNALLPLILEHIASEYNQNKVVLVHSHSSFFVFLERVYHALYNATHKDKAPDSFVHLRFRDYSPLSHEEAKKTEYQYDDNTWENLLFTNIVLFKPENHKLSDSWMFALTNYDATTKEKRERNWEKYIRRMFVEAGMGKAYEQILIEEPFLFEELKELFDKAIEEQRDYGRLIVISMPKELARTSVYAADEYGRHGFYIKGKKHNPSIETFFPSQPSSTDTPSEREEKNYIAVNSEWGLHLTQEFINPKDANQADVTIIGFDPTAHYRTSNYMVFETKLNEVIKEIIKIHHTIK